MLRERQDRIEIRIRLPRSNNDDSDPNDNHIDPILGRLAGRRNKFDANLVVSFGKT